MLTDQNLVYGFGENSSGQIMQEKHFDDPIHRPKLLKHLKKLRD